MLRRLAQMTPPERLRLGVADYPVEVVARAVADVLGLELAGGRLVAAWAITLSGDAEAPPLSDAQVDAILARLRAHVT